MANIIERRNKDGKLSFTIRVYRGRDADGKLLKPYLKKYTPENPKWSDEKARKEAKNAAVIFEQKCKEGTAANCKQKFRDYCDYVIDLKESRGKLKHSTAVRYRELTARVYPIIGNKRVEDIRTKDLNDMITQIEKMPNKKDGKPLSAKTVLEHHRLVSAVLEQAKKESLIPINPADSVTLPTVKKPSPNYFQPETLSQIFKELDKEKSIKWRTIIRLFADSAARRGEILGLKWSDIDFENNSIFIHRTVMYAVDKGVYVDTPKTRTSIRHVALSPDTMAMLKRYRTWQTEERLRLGEYYQDKGFLFAKDNGDPMHPDSVTDYLAKFSKKYGLPHINPHAFRHSAATALIDRGASLQAVSARLGHATMQTTDKMYVHNVDSADRKNASIMEEILQKKA